MVGASNGVIPLWINDLGDEIYFPAQFTEDAPLEAGYIFVNYSGKTREECIASLESATGCTTTIVEMSENVKKVDVFKVIPSQFKGLYVTKEYPATYSAVICIVNDEGQGVTVAWNSDLEKCIQKTSNGWTGNRDRGPGLVTELQMTVTDTQNFVIEYNGVTYTFTSGSCDKVIALYDKT